MLHLDEHLLHVVLQQQGFLFLDPGRHEGRSLSIDQFPRVPQLRLDLTEIENLYGVREHLLHHIPTPAGPLCQHDHFGGSVPPRVAIDLLKDRTKRLVVLSR
jgi:hypothetical protein